MLYIYNGDCDIACSEITIASKIGLAQSPKNYRLEDIIYRAIAVSPL